MFELALCNELLAEDGLSLDEQCAAAAALGYCGLELAPGTLSPRPHEIDRGQAQEIRHLVEAHGLRITGLHWLLAPYPDLSITDPARSTETRKVLIGLVELCAALGGMVLVHGSPGQRVPPAGVRPEETMASVAEFFWPIAEAAEQAGLTYCIEPLAPSETPFLNTVEEAAQLVNEVGNPAFRTMIDTSAAAQSENIPVSELIRRWVPTGFVGHIHVNESSRGAPGTGSDPFPDIVKAILDVGWDRSVSVEPFKRVISGTVTAAIGAATMRACAQAAR